MKKAIIFFVFAILFYSCNSLLEKRRYQKGFYFSHTNKKHLQKIPSKNDHVFPFTEQDVEDSVSLVAGTNNDPVIIEESNEHNTSLNAQVSSTESGYNNLVNADSLIAAPKIASHVGQETQKDKRSTNNDTSFSLIVGSLAALMFLLMIALKKQSIRSGSWAARNKSKSRIIITGLQLVGGSAGFMVGKELAQIGYNISNEVFYTSSIAFGALFLYGILKLDRTDTYTINEYLKKKSIHLLLNIAFAVCAIHSGNIYGKQKQINAIGSLLESISSTLEPVSSKSINPKPVYNLYPPCSDTIYMRDGKKYILTIISKTGVDYKYKKCPDVNGSTFSIERSLVSEVRYGNGETEFIHPLYIQPFNPTKDTVVNANKPPDNYNYYKPVQPREDHTLAIVGLVLLMLIVIAATLLFSCAVACNGSQAGAFLIIILGIVLVSLIIGTIVRMVRG